MRSSPEQRPSRIVIDPVTGDSVEFVISLQSNCVVCGRGAVIEVYDNQGQLVRRDATGQLCWHWRANQHSPQPRQAGGVDKI